MQPFDLGNLVDRLMLAEKIGYTWMLRAPGGLLHLKITSPPGVTLTYRRLRADGTYPVASKRIGYLPASSVLHAKVQVAQAIECDYEKLLHHFEAILPPHDATIPLEMLPAQWPRKWGPYWDLLHEGILSYFWMARNTDCQAIWLTQWGCDGDYATESFRFTSRSDADVAFHLLSLGRFDEAKMAQVL